MKQLCEFPVVFGRVRRTGSPIPLPGKRVNVDELKWLILERGGICIKVYASRYEPMISSFS